MTVVEPTMRLGVDGVDDLRVQRVTGRERAHEPYRYRVTAVAGGELDPEALIGSAAELTFVARIERGMKARVAEVELHDRAVTFVLEPAVASLSHSRDHRVFIDRDALDIAKSILEEKGITVDDRVGRTAAERRQCVQSFESDLAFVTRLLAEEGVLWHAESAVPEERMVLTDAAATHDGIEQADEIPYRQGDDAGLVSEEVVWSARLRHRVASDAACLRDYDFHKPKTDLTASAGDGRLEHYDAPGGYVDKATGDERAAIVLEQLRSRTVTLEAETSCRRVAVGRTLKLRDAPRDDLAGPWLVVDLHVEARDDAEATADRFRARFVAVPAEGAYRRPPERQPPQVGVQAGVLTGAGAEEITTNEDGSVRMLMRWDRRNAADDKASAWCRVVHPCTSGGFFLPRVGWEAVTMCRHGSPDEPWVLGRLDNGVAPPFQALPGKKVRSSFATPTTPGGGSTNELTTDDSAGNENLNIDASKNYNEKTTGNKASSTKGTQKHTVGAKQTLAFDTNHSLKVVGHQGVGVGGPRKVGVMGGIVIDAPDEMVAVGGVRNIKTGGDLTTQAGGSFTRLVGAAKIEIDIAAHGRHVSTVSTVGVGGTWVEASPITSVTTGGVSALGCAALNVTTGDFSMKASAITENAASQAHRGANCFYTGKASATFNLGSLSITTPTLMVSGKASVTINGGGGTIRMTPGSITVSGDFKVSGKAHFKQKVAHR